MNIVCLTINKFSLLMITFCGLTGAPSANSVLTRNGLSCKSKNSKYKQQVHSQPSYIFLQHPMTNNKSHPAGPDA